MLENSPCFPLSLNARPRIVQAGFATHGHKRIEHYRIYCYTLHLYLYRGSINVDGKDFEIRHGRLGVCPPGAKTVYRFDEKACRHLWFHFECGTEGTHAVPAMTDTGRDFKTVYRAAEEMLRAFHEDRLRADVKLWDLLFSISRPAHSAAAGPPDVPAPVRQALWFIEMNLGSGVTAAQAALAAECSHNHLNRLFLKHRGDTIKAWILKRQMERAQYFLTRTGISIKAAAHECGVPDLQHFNKLVRRFFGKPPRALRAGVPKP